MGNKRVRPTSRRGSKIGKVGLSEAIAQLAKHGDKIHLSTLSRYVGKYADALCPEKFGRKTIVDFEALLTHRARNVSRGSPPPLTAPPVTLSAPAPTIAPPPMAVNVVGGRADEAAANIRAQRQIRELDLAERVGALCPTDEVKEAATAAVAMLRTAFALALNDVAAAFGALGVDPKAARPLLKEYERKGLDAFVRALVERGMIDEAPPDAAE